ncbi:MAG: tagaturonate reductase, partial [Peptostreptococcaceae bacterium]
LEYVESKNEIPKHLAFSLAAFIKFYQGKLVEGQYIGTRGNGTTYAIRDDAEVIEFFANTWAKGNVKEVAHDVLSNTNLWSGKDLTTVANLEEEIVNYLTAMESSDMKEIVANLEIETILA